MRSYPKYSVLMSVYYREKAEWLNFSINSILNQTIICDEFVIVKDGPLTKELDLVIEEFTKKFPKIFKIIEIKKNMGLGPALKLGIENCKNEFIARIDSDDYSVPERCEKQLNLFLNDKNLDIVGSFQAEFIDNINNITSIKEFPEIHEEIIKYAKRRNPFSHSVVMFKKSKVLRAGNYREYYLCEDYDMWIRMIKSGSKCYNIQEVLNYVRVGEDLYKRRGGIKYLKTLIIFKYSQYKNGFYSFNDFIFSSVPHILVCLMPGNLRGIIYEKFLRKRK